jgi:hypothetical protein
MGWLSSTGLGAGLARHGEPVRTAEPCPTGRQGRLLCDLSVVNRSKPSIDSAQPPSNAAGRPHKQGVGCPGSPHEGARASRPASVPFPSRDPDDSVAQLVTRSLIKKPISEKSSVQGGWRKR